MSGDSGDVVVGVATVAAVVLAGGAEDSAPTGELSASPVSATTTTAAPSEVAEPRAARCEGVVAVRT